MRIDFLVVQTFERLAGVRALLELLDQALPESELRESEALRQLAEEHQWDFGDFSVETQILEHRFRFWLPRFSAYSVVTLLCTVLETQLAGCTSRVHAERQVSFHPTDVRGRGIDAAVLYIARAGVYDVRRDPAWQTICNIRDIRNLVVHRTGTKGHSDEQRRTAERLAAAYRGRLEFPDDDSSLYGEVWISIPLCRELIGEVEVAFDRIFSAMGLPPRFQARNLKSAG